MKNNSFVIVLATLLLTITACHKDEEVTISKPVIGAGAEITSDTLSGNVKGTLRSGKTYYFKTDITVNAGDTLLFQSGVTLIALGDGTSYSTSPQITVNGTLISLGTQTEPNLISVLPSLRTRANAFKGFWGGVQGGTNGGDIIIKWTRMEYAGGPAGPANDPAVYTAGVPRYTIVYSNIAGKFILEDSWIANSKDDGIRVISGKISVMRNTFECNGESGGEALNMKSGTVGDIGYNLIIGAATNALKASNSGGTTIQTNVAMYNNTILNCGFRQVQSGRGGSINFEKGAKGKAYNNIIINSRYGMRITTDADVANMVYDNQYYYASSTNISSQFYPATGVATIKTGDIQSATAMANNPQFANYNVNAFDYASATFPMGIAAMPSILTNIGTSDFRIAPASPAINKGKTSITPIGAVANNGGTYGANISMPGKDIGAYQADNSGNQHY
jgi:hypothetical protein